MKVNITIETKLEGQNRKRTNLPFEEGARVEQWRLEDLGKHLVSINPEAEITVSENIYSSISGTWMEMASYYANEDKYVTH